MFSAGAWRHSCRLRMRYSIAARNSLNFRSSHSCDMPTSTRSANMRSSSCMGKMREKHSTPRIVKRAPFSGKCSITCVRRRERLSFKLRDGRVVLPRAKKQSFAVNTSASLTWKPSAEQALAISLHTAYHVAALAASPSPRRAAIRIQASSSASTFWASKSTHV